MGGQPVGNPDLDPPVISLQVLTFMIPLRTTKFRRVVLRRLWVQGAEAVKPMVGNRVAQGRAVRVAVHFCWCVESWKCIAGGASRSMAKVGSRNSLSQVKEHLIRVACRQSVALAEGFMGPGVAEGRVAARSCVPGKSNSTGL